MLLDGDVAIDPVALAAMTGAAAADPAAVHTAPARLWPISTKAAGWVWGHGTGPPSQVLQLEPRWFSFCFTYLPRALIERAMRAGLEKWAYPNVDRKMSDLAYAMGIPVRVVLAAHPVHLNY